MFRQIELEKSHRWWCVESVSRNGAI